MKSQILVNLWRKYFLFGHISRGQNIGYAKIILTHTKRVTEQAWSEWMPPQCTGKLSDLHPPHAFTDQRIFPSPLVKKPMNFANMEQLNWQIGDVTTSAKGIKSAPLTDGKRQPELPIDNAGPSTARALWSIRLQRSRSNTKKPVVFACMRSLRRGCPTLTHTWTTT